MRARTRPMLTYISLLFLIAIAASVAGFGRSPAAPAPAPSASGTVPDLSGSWQGAWMDTVFAVVGPVTWDITQDATSFSCSGVNDLSAAPLNLGSAEPFSGSGTIAGNTLTASWQFDGAASLVGSGSFTITGTGPDNVTGTGNTGAPLNFGDFTYTLTATPTVIVGTFQFTSGGAGNFALARTSAVDPETWAKIKEKYRLGN